MTAPSWLDPAGEVTGPGDPRPARGRPFVRACFDALRALGCSEAQAVEVCAVMALETGWGAKYRGWNLGGVKATAAWAREEPNGKWWRAPGHVASGDKPEVYYRAYPSMQAFLSYWLTHFAPRPEGPWPYPGYREAGRVFWSADPSGFVAALIRRGYRGPVTARKPAASLRDHESIVRTVRRMVAPA